MTTCTAVDFAFEVQSTALDLLKPAGVQDVLPVLQKHNPNKLLLLLLLLLLLQSSRAAQEPRPWHGPNSRYAF
jgi:hypothetical protein